MPSATISASIMPCRPPSSEPIAMNKAVIAAISTAVFSMLNMKGFPSQSATTPWCPVDAGPARKFNARGPQLPMLRSACRQAEVFTDPRCAGLQEHPRGEPLAAGALQLGQSQRRFAAGHDDATLVDHEHAARLRCCVSGVGEDLA